jgi:hypothetical protein
VYVKHRNCNILDRIALPNGSVHVEPGKGNRFQPYPMVRTSRRFKLHGWDTDELFVLMYGDLLINETSQ